MPIYEFYCADCHTIFNFFARKIDTTSRPLCPLCSRRKLEREVSLFAAGKGGKGGGEEGGEDGLPVDEGRMEKAVNALANDAESINEDDPRQAAGLMRKFSQMTGMRFGENIEKALSRMESGEDPEQIEQEMGDVLEQEDPFATPEAGGRARRGAKGRARGAPQRDPHLYEL